MGRDRANAPTGQQRQMHRHNPQLQVEEDSPPSLLLQGSFDLTDTQARNLLAAARLHLVHLDKLPT
jgi:hypothetical protein